MTAVRSIGAVLAAPALAVAMVLPAGPVAPAAAQTVRDVFKRVNASVVVVRTKEQEVSADRQLTGVSGVGSGVLVSADGKVMTAAHVVQTADQITVEFLSGERVDARVVASEPEADVSLLQLDRVPDGATVARLGNSDRVEVGEQVFVVGAPYGIGHTLTVGHLSARHKPKTVYAGLPLAEFLQTDAAINQGNSGGPLFAMTGEVIGIVSHIISKSGGYEGLGFVVSSNMARQLLLERRSFWSGITTVALFEDLARALNVPQPVGVLIQRIARGSPAEQLGLRASTIPATIGGKSLLVGGDVILAVDGIVIESEQSYVRIQERLSRRTAGDEVTVLVLREGQVVLLSDRVP
jgi:serine protease Do